MKNIVLLFILFVTYTFNLFAQCAASITSGAYVSLDSINNSSTPPSGGPFALAVEDYKSQSTTLEHNGNYNLTVRSGKAEGAWDVDIKAWIDWDQDGNFSVSEEIVDFDRGGWFFFFCLVLIQVSLLTQGISFFVLLLICFLFELRNS